MTNDTITIIAFIVLTYIVLFVNINSLSCKIDKLKEEIRELKK